MAPKQFVAFDLETTGLFPESDRIVEIGAVRFDAAGRELGRFEQLVNPRRPVPPAAERVHGLSDADLRDAPTAECVLPAFLAWLGPPADARLLAHHARFDVAFLAHELARLRHPLPDFLVLDTLALARRRLPDAPDHRLDNLARRLGLDATGAHRALADSLLVKSLWLALDDGRPTVTFRFFDPRQGPPPPPIGWEPLADAIDRGLRARIRYAGGTHGDAPREIAPRRFVFRGGAGYLLAHCYRDGFEKSFRLDRVLEWELLGPA